MLSLLDGDSASNASSRCERNRLRLIAEELQITVGSPNQLIQRILATFAKNRPSRKQGRGRFHRFWQLRRRCHGRHSLLCRLTGKNCRRQLRRSPRALRRRYAQGSRKLILCVRDTPFSRIHLENMLRAQQAGAVIMPAILSYYHAPKTSTTWSPNTFAACWPKWICRKTPCSAGPAQRGQRSQSMMRPSQNLSVECARTKFFFSANSVSSALKSAVLVRR